MGDADEVVVLVRVCGQVHLANLHVRVQLAQLIKGGSVSAHFADVLCSEVEVGTEILDSDDLWVVDVDGAWAGEDEVLCNLDAELNDN